jgi:hypothetical protein
MPPRLLDERACDPLPPPNAELDRELLPPKLLLLRFEVPAELRFDDEPPKSRLPEPALDPPKSRLPELPPPTSRLPVLGRELVLPALREPAVSRVPT